MDSGKRYSPAIMSSSPPGLTDEEIDLAFQQSGTAAEEPPSLGPGTQVVPVQPPHLISQPYSKSPAQTPAVTLIGVEDSGHRAGLPPPRLRKRRARDEEMALGFFQKNVTHPDPLLDKLLNM